MVASRDVALAQRTVEAHWEAGLSAEARERSRTVIDLEAEENACPACGAKFRTSEGRCGDCGLRFG